MQRTTIMLPPDLKDEATRQARAQGVSLGELIRQALQEYLRRDAEEAPDPFFADREIFDGPVPADLSLEHDRHLYGESSDALDRRRR